MHSAFIVILISLLCKRKVMQLNFSSRSVLPEGIMGEWHVLCVAAFTKQCHTYHMLSYWDHAQKRVIGDSEMDQMLMQLAAKPDDLSSIPEIYMVDGKNQLLHAVFWSPFAILSISQNEIHPVSFVLRMDEVHIYCCFEVIWKAIILPGLTESQVVHYIN